jgi:hypothetical protein
LRFHPVTAKTSNTQLLCQRTYKHKAEKATLLYQAKVSHRLSDVTEPMHRRCIGRDRLYGWRFAEVPQKGCCTNHKRFAEVAETVKRIRRTDSGTVEPHVTYSTTTRNRPALHHRDSVQ